MYWLVLIEVVKWVNSEIINYNENLSYNKYHCLMFIIVLIQLREFLIIPTLFLTVNTTDTILNGTVWIWIVKYNESGSPT